MTLPYTLLPDFAFLTVPRDRRLGPSIRQVFSQQSILPLTAVPLSAPCRPTGELQPPGGHRRPQQQPQPTHCKTAIPER
jgi:hypothetical protein